MAHQASDNIDYEAKAEQRKDTFIARTTAAISGAIGGVLTLKFLERKALRQYIHKRLNTRDWTNGNVEEVFRKIINGEVETQGGAPLSEDKIKKFSEDYFSGKTKSLPGTMYGDPKVFAAYKSVLKEDPPFLQKAKQVFNAQLNELQGIHDGSMTALEKKFFNADVVNECRASVHQIESLFKKTRCLEQRYDAINALEKKGIFKGNAHKFFEEYEKIRDNFRHFTDEAKHKLLDVPIYDEIIKPERMGLKLRQVHNKGEIMAFSAVVAVAVGAVVFKVVKSYLKRNDKPEEESQSFQAAVTNQREAVVKNASASVRSPA